MRCFKSCVFCEGLGRALILLFFMKFRHVMMVPIDRAFKELSIGLVVNLYFGQIWTSSLKSGSGTSFQAAGHFLDPFLTESIE